MALLSSMVTVFFIGTVSVYAQVRINEVQIEPDQVIELVNMGTENMDLSGWILDDNGGSTFVTIPEDTWLAAGSCMVFQESFNLNKASADTARLLDGSLLIDLLAYAKSPGTGLSWQRVPDSSNTIIATASALTLWNESRENCLTLVQPTTEPTVQPTVTVTPIPIINNISLSEVMPNPDEGKEWVELYNDNDYNITLTNWYIDDVADGGAQPKDIMLTLPAKGYGVVYFSSALFNNSGDSVRLLNSSKQELASISYTDAPKNLSYSKNGEWCFAEPTPEEANVSCKQEELSVPTVSFTWVLTEPTIRLVQYPLPSPVVLGERAQKIPTQSQLPFKKILALTSLTYSLSLLCYVCYTETYDRMGISFLSTLLHSARGE